MVIVGEAWGESEARSGRPFAGYSGQELWRMLGEAVPEHEPEWREANRVMRYEFRADGSHPWLEAREHWLAATGIAFTNVLALRPPNNFLGALCGDKTNAMGYPPLGRTDRQQFPNGPFLRAEFLPELQRLFTDLRLCRPNLAVAAGNTASWALLRATNIGSIRGNVALSAQSEIDGLKILPTYHPAGVMRQWSWRPIVVADLMKAWRESQFAELRRPVRSVIVNPTLQEVQRWVGETLANPPDLLASDIETGQRQIKCIGFARSRGDALVVPFVNLPGAAADHARGSYWPTASQELAAWITVKALLESQIPKVFQNGLYDLQYILQMGIRPQALHEDTMLLHHSLFPEMQKGLGFLGSIYTNEASWKLMRRTKPDSEKKDE